MAATGASGPLMWRCVDVADGLALISCAFSDNYVFDCCCHNSRSGGGGWIPAWRRARDPLAAQRGLGTRKRGCRPSTTASDHIRAAPRGCGRMAWPPRLIAPPTDRERIPFQTRSASTAW